MQGSLSHSLISYRQFSPWESLQCASRSWIAVINPRVSAVLVSPERGALSLVENLNATFVVPSRNSITPIIIRGNADEGGTL